VNFAQGRLSCRWPTPRSRQIIRGAIAPVTLDYADVIWWKLPPCGFVLAILPTVLDLSSLESEHFVFHGLDEPVFRETVGFVLPRASSLESDVSSALHE
jgi:hypothetical protein